MSSKVDEFGHLPASTERKIKGWMRAHFHMYDNSTQLTEGCADELDLYLDDQDYGIPERMFELALEYYKAE
jgi:hypothetical protein